MLTPRLLVVAMLLLSGMARAQFVAFWDHVPGTNETQTHPNTTVTNMTTKFFRSRCITLKNITNGALTPVSLLMTNLELASGYSAWVGTNSANPALGTPLYNCFYYAVTNPLTQQVSNYSYVYFGRSTNVSAVYVTNTAAYYIFSGLNPSARYSFRGGAVGGGDTNSDMGRRWTQVELAGAEEYLPRMSSNVLTCSHTPDLAPNQVAVHFACNQTAATGDMVDWENIAPGEDGSFTIICSRYTGTVPGGSSNGGGGLVIVGFRLEEYFPPHLDILPQMGGTIQVFWSPGDGLLLESTNLTQWQPSSLTNGAHSQSTGQRFFRVRQ